MLHVFFDLDGTLTDSADGITRCLEHAIAELGCVSPARAEMTRFIGSPLREIFGELLETSDRSRIDRAVSCYAERFNRLGVRENSLYPGVLDALSQMRGLGVALYVATAKKPDTARDVVELFEIDAFFRGVHGVDHARIKDKTALLRDVAERELRGEPAIMVGDRHYDMDAGRAAGMSTVWANWGYGLDPERERAQPDYSVESFAELTELVRGMAREVRA